MSHRILVVTRSFGSTSEAPWDVLRQFGCEVVRADFSGTVDEARLITLLDGVEGAIVGVVPMTRTVIESATALKVVSMHGVGVDHIDLQAAADCGIVVANCLGSNNQAVADLTFGLILSIARNIPKIDRIVHQGGWGRYVGVEVWGKTLGLVGLGQIGREVARRALGFEMRVLVVDPFVDRSSIGLDGLEFASLEELLVQSDFVSLHAPLNDVTQGMIGSPQLSLMKPSAYLINTARGGLVDEGALCEALERGKIAGAALDVYQMEPPTGSPLLSLENVIATPHTGAHTKEAIERMGVMAAENVVRVLQGGEPHHRLC